MTEQEMWNKIIDTLYGIDFACKATSRHGGCFHCKYSALENCEFRLQADSLIKAGLRFGESYSHTATFNMAQLDRINELERRLAEAEHRAARVERALYCLARSFAEAMCKYGDDTHYLVDGFIQDAYSQAEKELAEEGNK